MRVESMDLLKERTGSSEVRDALMNAVAHDPNDGVRLKALEGLKPLVGDAAGPQDAVPGAADATRTRRSGCRWSIFWWRTATIRVVGVLQGLVQREDNNYVRLKLEKALKDMNASIGTF